MEQPSETLLRVLLVAPLRAAGDYATNNGWGSPVRFAREGFDAAMASVAPGVELEVEHRGRRHTVAYTFGSMSAFEPGAIASQVALLRPEQRVASRSAHDEGSTQSSLLDDIFSATASVPASAPSPARVTAVSHPPLDAFLAHPAVRGLERAWRGLRLLAERASDAVALDAMDAAAEDVAFVLGQLGERGAGYDLVVVDYPLGASRRDLAYLLEWASLAEGLGGVLVTNGLPELLGMDDLRALGATERRLRNSDDPRAVAFRAAVAGDAARSACVAMNGALARAPYAGPVAGVAGLACDEPTPLFLGPAVLVAALAVEAASRSGWACPATGVLAGFATHNLADVGRAFATEAPATREAAAEAAAAGVALFASPPDRGEVHLAFAPLAHRPAARQGIAAAPAPHALADRLFVARSAQVLARLAAELPASTAPAEARDAVRLALAELYGADEPTPELSVRADATTVEVTLRPRGFRGTRLDEVTLAARFG